MSCMTAGFGVRFEVSISSLRRGGRGQGELLSEDVAEKSEFDIVEDIDCFACDLSVFSNFGDLPFSMVGDGGIESMDGRLSIESMEGRGSCIDCRVTITAADAINAGVGEAK